MFSNSAVSWHLFLTRYKYSRNMKLAWLIYVGRLSSGGFQTIISVTGSSLVKGVGRKPPLFSFEIEFGVTTVGLALYFYLEIKTNVDLSAIDWIPITCLVFYVSLFSLSLGVLPLTIMGEIFLRNVKSLGALVAQLLSATCGLVGTKSLKLWPVILELTIHSRFFFCLLFYQCCVCYMLSTGRKE